MLPPFADEPAYYQHIARGYDLISGTYDANEAANAVGRRIRRKMQGALFRAFHPGSRVLEIGCGTGIEAIALANRGIDVVATDISSQMVESTRAKASEDGAGRVVAQRLAAHEIGMLLDDVGPAYFDGAYSHGGALNTDPGLEEVGSGLAALLKPKAPFVCTVVNQLSLFELLFYPLLLRPRKAFRRLGNDIPIPITRHEAHRNYVVRTRFYSPRRFVGIFQPNFDLRRLEGLQIILPPWNLADYVDRLPPWAAAAEAIENRISEKAPFNGWGSLFLAEFERTEK